MSRKLVLILIPLLSLMAVSGLFSQDFSIRPRGFAFFPLGEPSTSRYATGGGGGLDRRLLRHGRFYGQRKLNVRTLEQPHLTL
ncbi:MAG: hypothetical protein LBF95_01445 [Treponema sp.]|nr:hypothetical protein [Treponema sp.]